MELPWNYLWFFRCPTCSHQPSHHLMCPQLANNFWSPILPLSSFSFVFSSSYSAATSYTQISSSSQEEFVCIGASLALGKADSKTWHLKLMFYIIKTISAIKLSRTTAALNTISQPLAFSWFPPQGELQQKRTLKHYQCNYQPFKTVCICFQHIRDETGTWIWITES